MFCWHKWGKWVIVRELKLKDFDNPALTIGFVVYQKRECIKCGKAEIERTEYI